jgi:hypothetical protein
MIAQILFPFLLRVPDMPMEQVGSWGLGLVHWDQGFGTALGVASAVGSASFGVAICCLSSTANSI